MKAATRLARVREISQRSLTATDIVHELETMGEQLKLAGGLMSAGKNYSSYNTAAAVQRRFADFMIRYGAFTFARVAAGEEER